MPPRTSIPEMPEDVQAVIDVVGSHVRTEILRRLVPAAQTAPQLAQAMRVSRFSLIRHLGALELHGLVRADHARGHRRGTTVRWSTDTVRVAEFTRPWTSYVHGEP